MSNTAATSETIEAVRYAVTVPLPADQAFALFTDGYSSWWPGHHIGTAEMTEAVLEPRTGGRYFERGVDGSECEWGRVLACEPPDGGTLVELEHRNIGRHGAGAVGIHRGVSGQGGWPGILDNYARIAAA